MKQTTIYFDDELVKQIAAAARLYGEAKAEVIRESVRAGLREKYFKKSRSSNVLLELAKLGGKAPRDLAAKHDEYGWE